jgi:hypothetical protein
MTHCPHCAMMVVENERLRARVEALRSELDSERTRTHDAGERYRKERAKFFAPILNDAMNHNSMERGKS